MERISNARKWYVVAALSFATIVAQIDRQAINLLVEPIKLHLGLTDIQISLLQGFSFALLYSVLTIPIAWVADKYNRKWVILCGLVLWSAATFSSGLAFGFAALFMARMMVGIGEATLGPPGFSIINDYFHKGGLPAAISIVQGAGFVGAGLALILGGALISKLMLIGEITLPFGTFMPWQITFMLLASLTVPVFIAIFFIAEPKRQESNITFAAADAPPVYEVVIFLMKNARLYLPLSFGLASCAAAQFGVGSWAPSYFIRTHGWSQLQVGEFFGPVVIFAGLTGVVVGGFVATWFRARGMVDATLRVSLYAMIISLPFAVAFPLMASPFAALGLLTCLVLFGTVPFGAGISTFPMITPNRMQAQVIAVYLLIANLFGYSAGPLLVAWLTQVVFEDTAKVGLSLAIAVPLVTLIGIILIALTLKPFKRLVKARG